MKGWVYVISNKAMEGIIKVGHSTKDPELRAQELNHTGSPHPYTVEYEMLIEEPYRVEQAAHKVLSEFHEGKEWFRCTPEQAVSAIRQVAGNKQILENFTRPEQSIQKQERIGICPQCTGDLVRKEIGTMHYLRCKGCGQVFPTSLERQSKKVF
ncbi:MAG: GIY-YIG nuclease family protein [Deltaproteobacteria bacterium]